MPRLNHILSGARNWNHVYFERRLERHSDWSTCKNTFECFDATLSLWGLTSTHTLWIWRRYLLLCHLATFAVVSCIPDSWGIRADASSALAFFLQRFAALLVTHVLCSPGRIEGFFLSVPLLPLRSLLFVSMTWMNRLENTLPCTVVASFARWKSRSCYSRITSNHD